MDLWKLTSTQCTAIGGHLLFPPAIDPPQTESKLCWMYQLARLSAKTDQGCGLQIPDNDHNTPLEIALAHKHELAARMLGDAHAAFAEETAQPGGYMTQQPQRHASGMRYGTARERRR